MKDKILALQDEIILSIQFGKYKVKSIEKDDDWYNLKLSFTDYELLVGIDIDSEQVIFYDLALISRRLTDKEKHTIYSELRHYIPEEDLLKVWQKKAIAV